MPRDWVIKNIQEAANEQLDLENDEYEFRRLAEFYKLLDKGLLMELLRNRLLSKNPDIVEAAQDFRESI